MIDIILSKLIRYNGKVVLKYVDMCSTHDVPSKMYLEMLSQRKGMSTQTRSVAARNRTFAREMLAV